MERPRGSGIGNEGSIPCVYARVCHENGLRRAKHFVAVCAGPRQGPAEALGLAMAELRPWISSLIAAGEARVYKSCHARRFRHYAHAQSYNKGFCINSAIPIYNLLRPIEQ